MALAELIRLRRSISSFQPDPIPEGVIESLLETAVFAPNHHLTQPWRFVLLTGEGVQHYAAIRREMALPGFQKLADAQRHQAAEGVYHKFAHVPAYLLVIMSVNGDAETAEEDHAACAALIQNFLLLAWEIGIGTCWKTFKNDVRLKNFVGLEAYEKVVGIIHIGYPAELPTSHRQAASTRLIHIR